MASSSNFEEITNILPVLSKTFGIRNDLSQEETLRLRHVFETCAKKEKFAEFIREIKLMLNLPLSFRIQYECPRIIRDAPVPLRKFLLKTLRNQTGRAAWISIPSNFPLYGDPDLEDWTLQININQAFYYESFESFFYCVLHEMNHVLLKLVKPEIWENEKATDLLAMVLGFSKIVKVGMTSSVSGQAYGYLSEKEVRFAHRKISRLQENNGSLGKAMWKFFRF